MAWLSPRGNRTGRGTQLTWVFDAWGEKWLGANLQCGLRRLTVSRKYLVGALSRSRTTCLGQAVFIVRVMPHLAFLDDPDMWQERAEEARAIAENMSDPETKRLMHRVADTYETLAKRAKERTAKKQDKSSGGD